MADIQLRFNKDMLVMSAPLDATLARQGIAPHADRQYLNLMEPDSVQDALHLQALAGAQCLLTTTEDITAARLAHTCMQNHASELSLAALSLVREQAPQHVLVEVGPCGLPLDEHSKSSLNESRSQYAQAARLFEAEDFDAFVLHGFASISDMKCALMGLRQVSDKPIFASMLIGEVGSLGVQNGGISSEGAKRATTAKQLEGSKVDLQGDFGKTLPFGAYTLLSEQTSSLDYLSRKTPLSPACLEEAVSAMQDLGASVIGFETAEPLPLVLSYVQRLKACTTLPTMVSLRVIDDPLNARALGLTPLEEVKSYIPDTLVLAAQSLRDAGVQFLRATGDATAVHTGALAAAVAGDDVKL